MWTGPNVPDDKSNDLYLQNINRNQTGTSYCTATNEWGSKMSSNVVVDVRCKLILYLSVLFPPIHCKLITGFVTRVKRWVSCVEQELLTSQDHLILCPDFIGVHVARSFAFYLVFCSSLFVLIWQLYCHSFFDNGF